MREARCRPLARPGTAVLDTTAPEMARLAAGSAVLYFLQAVDAIDDFLWPIGYLDDAIAVALAEMEVRRLMGEHWAERSRESNVLAPSWLAHGGVVGPIGFSGDRERSKPAECRWNQGGAMFWRTGGMQFYFYDDSRLLNINSLTLSACGGSRACGP